FLLRACTYHQSEVLPIILRHCRNWSPLSGASILITSAPNSASNRPHDGPAISVPSSMTFMPCSGSTPSALMISLLASASNRSVAQDQSCDRVRYQNDRQYPQSDISF